MSAESEELYSLLVPLTDDRLIVPRACVAEVVRFSKAETQEGSHDWMMGTVNWNGRPLPVISFEGAIGKRFCPLVMVVSRWPMRTESGRSLSYHSCITGL